MSMSKEEYLKRYLSGSDVEDKKKKKKKRLKNGPASSKASLVKIIDDDVDFHSLLPANINNTLEEDIAEDDDPVVAEYVDERPLQVQQIEAYRQSKKWQKIVKDEENENSRTRHDSDSDQSPRRKSRHDSDSDNSPIRTNTRTQRHDSDSDNSPVRKKDSEYSSSSAKKQSRHDSDSDRSPPRKQKRHDSDSDQSPPSRGRGKVHSDSNPSKHRNSDSDQSPPRRQNRQSDSDQSPPRKRREQSDSDQSPPRKRRQQSDSDQSPPRRLGNHSDSDQSPPRRRDQQRKTESQSKDSAMKDSSMRQGRAGQTKARRRRWDSPEPKPKEEDKDDRGRAKKTLAGATAGLQSAKAMKEEAIRLKKKELEAFNQIDESLLGRNAETVFRSKQSGKRRDLDAEAEEDAAEEAKKAAKAKKYKEWGQGLKQREDQEVAVQAAAHEMSKPLARYKDDKDLDSMLKDQDREGDPMLAFLKKKKSKGQAGVKVKERPTYKGPEPHPNRFGIKPGYRWDGVDRSNGFEKDLFKKAADRRATAKDAYKWSVEDM